MRIRHIDILRGLAALCVVLFHLTGDSNNPKLAYYGRFGWLGVHVFFVISGFILPLSMHKGGYTIKKLPVFICKRLYRIYPPYVAAILFHLCLALITGRHTESIFTIGANLTFTAGIVGVKWLLPVFWTLAIEFQFYLILGFIYPHFITSAYKSVTAIACICAIGIIIPGINYIFHWFPFFAMGILLFNLKFSRLSVWLYILTSTGLLMYIVLTQGISEAVATLIATLFIAAPLPEKGGFAYKTLLWFGTISYSLYVIHWDLQKTVYSISRRSAIIAHSELLQISLGFILSVAGAVVLYYLVEKHSAALSNKLKFKTHLH